MLTFAFANTFGLYLSLGCILSQFFGPFGKSAFEVAISGFLVICSGAVGSTITGMILDKTAAYKKILLINLAMSTISLGLVAYSLFN